ATQSICQGGSYLWRGKTLSSAGVYYDSLLTVNGCDSVFQLTLTVNPTYFTPATQSICQGGNYLWRGKTLSSAGVYYDSLLTVNGCDSVFQLTLTVNSGYFFPASQSICQGGNYNWRGKTLYAAGTYYDSLLTVNGCDSVFQLTLTVNPAYFTPATQSICAGGNYLWRGKTLTLQDVYRDTLTSIGGCDSILELTLNVLPVYTQLFENICQGQSYNFNGTMLNSAGTYYDTLQNVLSCDSVVELNLSVFPVFFVPLAENICYGETFNFNGTMLNSTGVYYDTLTSVLGCDSIVEMSLTVEPQYLANLAVSICEGGDYYFKGAYLTTAGTYYDTLQSLSGCDSIVELDLQVVAQYLTPIAAAICDGGTYLFAGQTLSTAGVYYDTLTSVLGCDSIIELTLTVNPTYLFTETETICEGDSYDWHGQSYTATGIYYDNLLTQEGCDSIYALDLTVNPSYRFTETANITQGGTYLWHGQTYTDAGTYYDSLLTQEGCDSIYELTLNVLPFVAVSGITDAPATAVVNEELTLAATVNPANASNQTIEWSLINAGTTNASVYSNDHFFASAEGVAIVKATIKDGKAIGEDYTQSFSITVSNVGIANYELGSMNYVVYPNPTDGKFSVFGFQFSEMIGEIEIYDVVGRKYDVGAKHILPNNEIVIDISHLASGLYFLKIQTDNGTVMKKVVKQ
ncbi:MAG: T9SS type A sorting domain-containing protein, partial [Lentimicrobiaceae bacterium]|nr:T9SS type A sorting domain-containing protein [Lentimicrobiaceae bacterium]